MAADHAVLLSLLHGRLRPAARDHPPGRAHGLRAGPDLPGLRFRQAQLRTPAAQQLARAWRRAAHGLAAGHRHGDQRAVCAFCLRGHGVSRGQPQQHRRGDGQRAAAVPAGGHAPGHGLAAGADRAGLHGLCRGGAVDAGSAVARGRQLVAADQPPVPHQPGHLRRGGRGCGDLRLSLRAVWRHGHPHRPGPAVSGHRDKHRRPLCRRPGQGQRVRLGHVRHAERLLGGQRRDGWLADHPGHDQGRLPAPLRGGGGGRIEHRGPDHAAGAGRCRLPDDRVPERALPDDHHCLDLPGLHALLRRLHAGAFRGQALRPAWPSPRRNAAPQGISEDALAHADSPVPADRHHRQRTHTLHGRLRGHQFLRHRGHDHQDPRQCGAQLGRHGGAASDAGAAVLR